jgi:hypothetical protein
VSSDGKPSARWLRPFGRRRAPGREVLAEHPTPEALTAYDADELTPEQDGRIQEHFLECRDCPELLLDYKTFSAKDAEAQEVPGLSEGWIAASWESLRTRLASEARRGGWRSFLARLRRRLSSLTLAYAVAAVSLACMMGLSAWVAFLHREVGRMQEPQLNPTIVNLSVAEPTRGDPVESLVVVPAGSRSLLLVLVPLREPMETEHRLEIWTRKGREVWSGGGLTRTADGTFVVELSRRFLAAGEYLVRLLRNSGRGEPALVEEYAVRLVYQ